jgi:ATP-dependent DNA ligase
MGDAFDVLSEAAQRGVGFTEWTDDGRLRHPRHLGLRCDGKPADVVRERPGRWA